MMISVSTVNAQSAATATAAVTVISPVVFSKIEDISFKSIPVNSSSSQELIVSGGGQKFHTLYIPKILSVKNTNKGVFRITTNSENYFSISSDDIITLIQSNRVDKIYGQSTIDESLINIKTGETELIVDTKVFFDHTQLPGLYTSKNFTVTVNFN